jgi:isoquinoline 1-oxidoreductase
MTDRATHLTVNGEARTVATEPDRPLLAVLRNDLGLTGTKYGCGEGECGSCTVLLGGAPVRSCQVPLVEVGNREVTTVEGLARDGSLHPVQAAFAELTAYQCGYCTPGMVVRGAALLQEHPHPTDGEVRSALDRNLCRCGGYARILRAVRRAAEGPAAPRASPRPAPSMGTPARPRRPWDLTPVGEREFFELLGPGLVAVLPPRRPGGGGAGEWQPPTGGAWVHVGEDGGIRAFTGKAEVGQGTRAALSKIVAEELRVPVDRVVLVMADTDLSPWDMGTFGSRSMPDALPALGRAVAGAREALIAIAAERTGTGPSTLEAVDGAVRVRGGPTTLSYGTLVAGLHRIEMVGHDQPLTRPGPWSRAGPPVEEPGAVDVVTGRRVFVSDLQRPGMLYGVWLHPPMPGARLRSVDLDAARSRPGVVVLHDGEFVGVAAGSPLQARAALAAMTPAWHEAPLPTEREMEAHLRSHPQGADGWDRDEIVEGDADAAFAGASVRVEGTYRAAYIAHVPLETHCAVAEWDGPRLTVWVGTQTPFRVRDSVAEALGIGPENVRIIVPPTGGGFGGKHGSAIAIAAARLARAAGRPVRVAFSREEEFRHAYLRPLAIIDVKAGAEPAGRLSAWVFHNVNAGAAALTPPYRIGALKVDNELSDSPLAQGSYRALAANTNNFARECAIDELAHACGRDPVAFRETNLSDDRLRAVLRRAVEKAGWSARDRRPGQGIGVAVGLEKGCRVATVAEVSVDDERRLRVRRLVTAVDAGAIVHPENLRSQVEGATVMALGGALFEAIRFDPHGIRNPRLADYRVPRFSDLPTIEVELLDRPDLPSAGAGETPMIAVAPAVANAVFDATGCRLRSLPLTPDGTVSAAPPS